MTRLAGLLLAAGGGSRFGGRKQLAVIDGQPLARLAAQRLAPLFGPDLHAVVGAFGDEVAPVLADRCQIIDHPGWRQGLGSSIARGVGVLRQAGDYDGVLIALADQVGVTEAGYRALLDAFTGQAIIAAHYAGRTGVPALFPRRCFAELEALKGDRGARPVLEAEAASVIHLPLPEAAWDIDTREDAGQR